MKAAAPRPNLDELVARLEEQPALLREEKEYRELCSRRDRAFGGLEQALLKRVQDWSGISAEFFSGAPQEKLKDGVSVVAELKKRHLWYPGTAGSVRDAFDRQKYKHAVKLMDEFFAQHPQERIDAAIDRLCERREILDEVAKHGTTLIVEKQDEAAPPPPSMEQLLGHRLRKIRAPPEGADWTIVERCWIKDCNKAATRLCFPEAEHLWKKHPDPVPVCDSNAHLCVIGCLALDEHGKQVFDGREEASVDRHLCGDRVCQRRAIYAVRCPERATCKKVAFACDKEGHPERALASHYPHADKAYLCQYGGCFDRHCSEGSNLCAACGVAIRACCLSHMTALLRYHECPRTENELYRCGAHVQGGRIACEISYSQVLPCPHKCGKALKLCHGHSLHAKMIIDENSPEYAWRAHRDECPEWPIEMKRRDFAAAVEAGGARLRELERIVSCVVCMDKPRACLALPCSHSCVCGDCIGKIKDQCPICREPITSVLPIIYP